MAHEITHTDSLFVTRKPAWHGLGTVFENYPTRSEAQAIAHPWEPVSEPIYLSEPTFTSDENGDLSPHEVYTPAPGFQAIRRSDNGDLLGVVSDTYEPVTNNEMWDIAEAIQGSGVDVRYETGGSLRGGSKVWLLLTLDEPLTIPGDPNGATVPYYSLQNSHDGSGSFRGQATVTRIVCANTAQVADLDAKARGTEFTFRHTRSVTERIEEAREALLGWRSALDDYVAISTHLLDLTLPDGKVSAEEFVDRFLPEPPPGLATERVRSNVSEARRQWWTAFNSATCEGITGTARGLVEASIEYAEHYRRARSAETRFVRSFMDRNRVTSDAVKIATSIAR